MRAVEVIVVSVMTWLRPEPSVAAFPNSNAASPREAWPRKRRGLEDRIAELRSAAGKEKQMLRRVELNEELARLRADREAARAGP